MAKKPTVTTISSGYYSTTALNNNFTNIRDSFDNTLSLDGSTPNTMSADLDVNSNDLLNVNDGYFTRVLLGGTPISTSAVTVTAGGVSVSDAGAYFADSDVEAVLQDIGANYAVLAQNETVSGDWTFSGTSDFASITGASVTSENVEFGVTLSNLNTTPPKMVVAYSDPAQTFTYSDQTEMVVARNGDTRVTIASGTNNTGLLSFADPDSESVGEVSYDHSTDDMIFQTGSSERMRLDSNGLEVNEDSLVITNTTPQLRWTETDVGADEGEWRLVSDAGDLYLQSRADGNLAGQDLWRAFRTAASTTITEQQWYTGGSERMSLTDSGLELGNTGARVTQILDEDTMVSDSATSLATQQSIKAYVDSASAGITEGTVHTTSGSSSYSWTSLPAGLTEIILCFDQVGLSSVDDIHFQLGDSGGFETSGYISGASTQTADNDYTLGFGIFLSSGSLNLSGTYTLHLMDSANNTWVGSGDMIRGTAQHTYMSGTKSLSGELTQVRIKSDGINTFTNGKASILYR